MSIIHGRCHPGQLQTLSEVRALASTSWGLPNLDALWRTARHDGKGSVDDDQCGDDRQRDTKTANKNLLAWL